MKTLINLRNLILIFLLNLMNIVNCQITETDGDWSARYVGLRNTSQAMLMVRTGDIDNLGFGWDVDFNPFSGNNTSVHNYPWTLDPDDPTGTDRIMVVSGFVYGTRELDEIDGYTNETLRPDNAVLPIELNYTLDSITVNSAILQIFVDDFQAPQWGTSYEVTIDNVRVPFLESAINSLLQTGPIGKIISLNVPADYIYLLRDGKISIKFDDNTTGETDGYAIDFVKLLINPTNQDQYGTITGHITLLGTTEPIVHVRVVANGLHETYTNDQGDYILNFVNPGLISVQTFKDKFGSEIKSIELADNETAVLDFELYTPAPKIKVVSPPEGSVVKYTHPISVYFDQEMNKNTFNSKGFVLTSPENSVSGLFLPGRDAMSFIFIPNDPLEANTEYRATVTTSVRNSIDIAIDGDYSWTFKTVLKDLQDTIDEAVSGSTVIITNGTHYGRGDFYYDGTCGNCSEPTGNIPTTKGIIIRNKEMHLVGETRDGSIINTCGAYGVLFVNAGNSSVRNLTVTGGVKADNELSTNGGIVVKTTTIEIEDVNIIENDPTNTNYPGVAGIVIREGVNATINNCLIENNGWDGIVLYRGYPYGASPKAIITNNKIGWNKEEDTYNPGAGIGLTWDSEAIIKNNEIYRYWKGIGFFGESKGEVYNNIVRDQIGWGVICNSDTRKNIKNNIIINNGRTGIEIASYNDETVITNNIIMHNGYKRYGRENTACTGTDLNTFLDAGVAFYYDAGNYGRFEYNLVFNNKVDYARFEYSEHSCNDYEEIDYVSTGNISEDPLFRNLENHDFFIDCNSPAMDAGNPETSDRDRNNTQNDMGIYGGPYSSIETPLCEPSGIANSISSGNFKLVISPNPFSTNARLDYFLPEMSEVTIEVHTILGEKVASLINQEQTQGKHSVQWNGCDIKNNRLSQGIYIIIIKVNNEFYIHKLNLKN